MAVTRRQFFGSVSAAAAAAGLNPGELLAAVDDPLGVRRDFPVVLEGTYLDSAYITPSPQQAVDAAKRFAETKARSPVSLGRMLEENNEVRRLFAQLVGANTSEVGVLYATSDGENVVSRALDLGAGDNVVVDDLHYETTYLLYQHLAESRGLEVRVVPNQGGAAPAESFAEYVDDRTRLISVAWVSHQNGFRHDLTSLADLAHAHGAYLYADAIQGIGMLDLDVKATGIDFLAAGTYKWLLGGYGAAPFYVREELQELIVPDRLGSLSIAEELGGHRFSVHDDAKKYGYATMAFGAVFQLRSALDYLLEVGVPNIERHTVALAQRLHEGLTAQGYDVWTPARNRSAIVTFNHGRDVNRVRSSLEEAAVRVSLKEGGVQLRMGIALFNNTDDIDRLLEVTRSWT